MRYALMESRIRFITIGTFKTKKSANQWAQARNMKGYYVAIVRIVKR